MSWFQKIFRRSRQRTDALRTLNLRCTRFRQLVRNYGRILDAIADAAEKQGGDYILDRQYLVSLSEVVIDITEAIVFDLNVLAAERYNDFYDLLDQFRAQTRVIISKELEGGRGVETEASAGPAIHRLPATETEPGETARDVSDSKVVFRQAGQIACRGIAAGPVFNLETEPDPDAFPRGAVMVASDIAPDERLIRCIRQASAILTDFGEPAGETATLVREFNIPSIVGLEDASRQLKTGTEITVNADENAVYLGRVRELLEHYDSERVGPVEEAEYRTLRRLRRFMFPLTLGSGAGPGAELGDCRTVHDLVHLAHELAGEAHFELIAGLREIDRLSRKLTAGFGIPVYVIETVAGSSGNDGGTGARGLDEICSLPLRTFVRGMDEMSSGRARSLGTSVPPTVVTATATEEHANIMVRCHDRFDIVDSMIGESRESNHIYCRFASSSVGNESSALRGAVSRDVLSRLNFAAAQTTRATAAWLSGIPRADMEECLGIVGRLSAYLLDVDAAGWDGQSSDPSVDRFMAQWV